MRGPAKRLKALGLFFVNYLVLTLLVGSAVLASVFVTAANINLYAGLTCSLIKEFL